MKKYVFTSLNKDAGKTGIIIGLTKLLNKNIGYLKPFGDRLVYKDKRLWDIDAAIIAELLGLEQSPEDLSIGFDHSKLHYLYDENSMKDKLNAMISKISGNDADSEPEPNIKEAASEDSDSSKKSVH